MEYSSSDSRDGSISEGSELSQRKITSLPTTTKSQMFGDKAACSSTGRKTMPQPKNYQEKQRNTNTQEILNPFAPGDFAEKRVLKLVEWFSGHCRAIKS